MHGLSERLKGVLNGLISAVRAIMKPTFLTNQHFKTCFYQSAKRCRAALSRSAMLSMSSQGLSIRTALLEKSTVLFAFFSLLVKTSHEFAVLNFENRFYQSAKRYRDVRIWSAMLSMSS